MRSVSVGKVAAVFNGKTPSKAEQRRSGFPVLKIKDIDDAGYFRGRFTAFVDHDLARKLNDKVIRPGDILILNAAHNSEYVGTKIFFASGSAVGSLATGEWLIIRPDSTQVEPRFLYYWSLSSEGKLRISGLVRGIHLYPGDVAEIPLDLPSRSEQDHFVKVLEKADRLRRMRRSALELVESVLESVFLRMFGNPIENPKGWRLLALGDLGELDRGRSKHRPRNAPHLYGGPYPFIQTGEVANSRNYIADYSQSYSEAGLKQSRLWRAGTLCITIAANIAKTGILRFDACFPDSIVGFTPNDDVTTEYIHFWLRFIQTTLERTAPESAQKNINLEILRDLPVPVPPISLQQEFAEIVAKQTHLCSQHNEGLRQAEHLFQTLLHQAFAPTAKEPILA